MLFVGIGDKAGTTVNNGTDLTTFGATYTSGGFTVGAQRSSLDKAAANADVDRNHLAVSFCSKRKLVSIYWYVNS